MPKTIGQASQESGVGIETIRYYERENIVPTFKRGSNGRRIFEDEDIVRLRFIKRFRLLGFSIEDIQNLQKLTFDVGNNCKKAAAIGRRNLAIVQEKISDLQRIEGALNKLICECERNPRICPILSDLR